MEYYSMILFCTIYNMEIQMLHLKKYKKLPKNVKFTIKYWKWKTAMKLKSVI